MSIQISSSRSLKVFLKQIENNTFQVNLNIYIGFGLSLNVNNLNTLSG